MKSLLNLVDEVNNALVRKGPLGLSDFQIDRSIDGRYVMWVRRGKRRYRRELVVDIGEIDQFGSVLAQVKNLLAEADLDGRPAAAYVAV